MSDTRHVVLIHGNWSRGEQLAAARAEFEERGYTAHTPTLRHHDLPRHEGAMKTASLRLRDYTDDLVGFVNSLDSPPLLVRLSASQARGAQPPGLQSPLATAAIACAVGCLGRWANPSVVGLPTATTI